MMGREEVAAAVKVGLVRRMVWLSRCEPMLGTHRRVGVKWQSGGWMATSYSQSLLSYLCTGARLLAMKWDSGLTYIKTVIFATKIVEEEMSVDLPARQRGFLQHSTIFIDILIFHQELRACLHAKDTIIIATQCK